MSCCTYVFIFGRKGDFLSFDLSHLEFFMYEKGLKGSFAFN